ncbi:MAG: ArnT family glycosyltransferase [Desulfovibrionales bacterium]
MSTYTPPLHSMRRMDLTAAAIILATTLIRFVFVAGGALNLSPDEAQYWDWSRTLQLSYYSKGPLVAYIIGFWTEIFGNTELGVRFGAVFGSMMTQSVLYLGLSRLWGRPRLGAWVLVLVNTMPLFLASGVLMTTDNPLIFCWIGCFFLLYRMSTPQRKGYDPYLFGLLFGLGILGKYMMLVFAPIALVFVWMLRKRGDAAEGTLSNLLLGLGLGLVIGFLPIVLWNLQNDWVGFRHVATLGGVSGSRSAVLIRFDRFPEYIGSQIGLLTPWWFAFLLWGGWQTAKGLLPAASLRFGLNRPQALLLTLSFWPLWLFFILWSFHTRIYGNWPAVTYAGGIILAALAWERFWDRSPRERVKKAVLGLGLAVFCIVQSAPFLPIPAEVNPMHRLMGWDDLGTTIAQVSETMFENPSKVFLLSDRYGVTAGLSFYGPGQTRAFNVDEGRRMTQYDLWPGPQDKVGWDALYVRKHWDEKVTPEVGKMFDRIGEKIIVRTEHLGKPGRRFALFPCYGYNGHWPQPEKDSF